MANFCGAFPVKGEGRPQTRTSFQRRRLLAVPMDEHGNVTCNYLNINGRPTRRERSSSPQRYFIEFNTENVLCHSRVKSRRYISNKGSRLENDCCETPYFVKSVDGQARMQSQDFKENRKTFRSSSSGWQGNEEVFQHETNAVKVQCQSNSLFDYSFKFTVDGKNKKREFSSEMSRSSRKHQCLQRESHNFLQRHEFCRTSRGHRPRCSTEPFPTTLNCSVCEGPQNPRQISKAKQTQRRVAGGENPTMQRRSGQFLARTRKITTKMSQHHLRSKSSGDCGLLRTTRLVKQTNHRRHNVFVEDPLLQGRFEAIAGKAKKVNTVVKQIHRKTESNDEHTFLAVQALFERGNQRQRNAYVDDPILQSRFQGFLGKVRRVQTKASQIHRSTRSSFSNNQAVTKWRNQTVCTSNESTTEMRCHTVSTFATFGPHQSSLESSSSNDLSFSSNLESCQHFRSHRHSQDDSSESTSKHYLGEHQVTNGNATASTNRSCLDLPETQDSGKVKCVKEYLMHRRNAICFELAKELRGRFFQTRLNEINSNNVL